MAIICGSIYDPNGSFFCWRKFCFVRNIVWIDPMLINRMLGVGALKNNIMFLMRSGVKNSLFC